jgi:hypothetical protein
MGKKKPVTLVRVVPVRNTAVHASRRFAETKPHITKKPAKIPIKLSTT